ncbi:hypothetical protein LTR56_000729 [Elasticomyces elasticus]|nr:hypothetical protein LTR22_009114 [Elasticomyces elasticus]KAK3660353.1 hypothetical protein LTR56_000729 [Elasticomyces elasticus]KAK4929255.1 hypothetical protein LTR49_004152 [Elasticomyces elasticus]KAK5765811.1 hypothetical protein LTS12_004071 [Elasticomyces elasticus]
MAPKLVFDPVKDIPSLSGKVILVTGGTAGLGRETVLSFAAHTPAHIFFTGRSQSSADSLVKEAKSKFPEAPVTFVQCDLASLESVQKAAKSILEQTDRLDIGMLNAGVMALPPGLTKDVSPFLRPMAIGTADCSQNHIGHALLVKLLTPLLESTAKRTSDVRLVWNTSLGYKGHLKGGIFFDKLKTTQSNITPALAHWMRYGQSKLANLVYSRAYANKHPSITSVSIHPGVSATGLVTSLSFANRMFVYATNINNMISAEECAWNQEWAATAPLGTGKREVQSGKYYEPVGIEMEPTGEGKNDELAEKLWNWTQDELASYN